MGRWPKSCLCGASYWPPMWNALTFVGILDLDKDAPLELRNCRCGSTIAVESAAAPGVLAARAFDACAASEALRERLRELVPRLVIFRGP